LRAGNANRRARREALATERDYPAALEALDARARARDVPEECGLLTRAA
jgi:hypothetical protein